MRATNLCEKSVAECPSIYNREWACIGPALKMQGAGKLDRSDNSRLRHTQMVRGDWHRSASNHRAVFRKAPLSLQFWIIITGRVFPFHPTFRPSLPSIIRALLVRFLYSEIRGEYLSIRDDRFLIVNFFWGEASTAAGKIGLDWTSRFDSNSINGSRYGWG